MGRESPAWRVTMQEKLVHGTNSVSCANSVLPAFTGIPKSCQPEETTQKYAIRFQISTKQHHPQSRVIIGFPALCDHVERTTANYCNEFAHGPNPATV